MNETMRRQVVHLLETYRDRARQISLLRYELEHPRGISPDEMIDQMSFGHGEDGPIDKNRISNKTLYIALNYQEQIDKINKENTNDIANNLVRLEQEQSRIDYYISLLEERRRNVIKLSYFERLSQEQVAEKIGISVRTVQTAKAQALNELTRMYIYTARME